MKRNRKNNTKRNKLARSLSKRSQSLSYDSLEKRQVLTAGLGLNVTGASFADADINTVRPNAEGDVGPNHFVEVGNQTFTVYDRNGNSLVDSTLDEFFLNAGGNLRGEQLESPRVIYDRLSERWFIAATGDNSGPFAGNWLHVAVSDTSDPSGTWKQVEFIPETSGLLLATDVSLGVDADGVYLATRNMDPNTPVEVDNVSIFVIPKNDLLQVNPTEGNLARYEQLDTAVYGDRIQFASSFEASDGSMFAFSNKDATTLNSIEINFASVQQGNALPVPVDVNVDGGNIPNPSLFIPTLAEPEILDPLNIEQPVFNEDGSISSIRLEPENGLTSGLIESGGSILGARTVGLGGGFGEFLTNGIHWFELNVSPGEAPALGGSLARGPNSHIIYDFNTTGTAGDDNGNMIAEFGRVSYFNPSIAINETGLVSLVFNGTTTFDAATLAGGINAPQEDFGVFDENGLPVNSSAIRTSVFAAVGLRINGIQTRSMGELISPVQSIQLEAPQLIATGRTADAFAPGDWGSYSSVRPDPANPNSFFAVVPAAGENADEWSVQVAEIQPFELRPVIEAASGDDTVVIRRDATDVNFLEVEINGEVTDRFDSSLIGQFVILTFGGADYILIDHTNGDPTPENGFAIFAGGGTDTVETNASNDVEYLINTLDAEVQDVRYPLYLGSLGSQGGVVGAVDGENPEYFLLDDFILETDGFLTQLTDGNAPVEVGDRVLSPILDVETILSGSGDDDFIFVANALPGNVEGNDGDDRFVFEANGAVLGSVNGGGGFNTLDLSGRAAPTRVELFFNSTVNNGMNGLTPNGPIGAPGQFFDQFRDINLIRGSQVATNNSDELVARQVPEATFTFVASNISPFDARNPLDADSFIASTYEADGRTIYFTEFESVIGSLLNDEFNIQSNDSSEVATLSLDGNLGNDTFNFSSNAPTNTGTTADIGGLIMVEGGGGNNAINVSEESRPEDVNDPSIFQVASQSISGPVEIVYRDNNSGNFDITIIGSDSAADTFILESMFATNTLKVFGLNGNDVFFIRDLTQAEIQLFGGEGDDEYVIEQVGGFDDRNVLISDSVDSENDRVLLAGTLLNEIFIVDIDSFDSDQFTYIGIEEFGFDGRGGDDEFYVRGVSVDFPVILRGGDGNDTFYVSSDAPINIGDLSRIDNDLNIDGGSGTNKLMISNESGAAVDVEITSTEITGLFNGVLGYTNSDGGIFDAIEIIGSNGGDDRFLISSFLSTNTLRIDGRLGEDEFSFGGTGGEVAGNVSVDGASDGDTYNISLANLNSQNIDIGDSGFSGSDILNATGSELNDDIQITEFNISSDTVSVAIGDFIEQLIVSGLGGDDSITVSNAPTDLLTLSGNTGNDSFILNGTVGVSQLDIFGGALDDGADAVMVNGSSELTDIVIQLGDGSDFVHVSSAALGSIAANGQLGDDVYLIDFLGSGARSVNVVDTGISGFDSATFNGSSTADTFFVNNNTVSLGSESVIYNGTLESIQINGLSGSDAFNVIESSMELSLDGGAENDVFNLNSDAPAQTGNGDSITGHVSIEGGAGLNHLNLSNRSELQERLKFCPTRLSA